MKRKIFSVALIFALLFCFTGAVSAANFDGEYILDAYGLLAEEEKASLEDLAQNIDTAYDCGIYTIIIDSYEDYDYDVYNAAVYFYEAYGLGAGSGADGMLLLLSMNDRDYATFVYGSWAEEAISEYGVTCVEDAFLDDFSSDDWYAGLTDYYQEADELLAAAKDGTPAKEPVLTGTEILIAVGIPLLFSFVICLIQRGKMKTARVQTRAQEYVPAGGLNFRMKRDRFTHITRSRVKVQTNNSGSSSRSGGGGHGSSGKF